MRQYPYLGDSFTYSFTYQIKHPLRVESTVLKTAQNTETYPHSQGG